MHTTECKLNAHTIMLIINVCAIVVIIVIVAVVVSCECMYHECLIHVRQLILYKDVHIYVTSCNWLNIRAFWHLFQYVSYNFFGWKGQIWLVKNIFLWTVQWFICFYFSILLLMLFYYHYFLFNIISRYQHWNFYLLPVGWVGVITLRSSD